MHKIIQFSIVFLLVSLIVYASAEEKVFPYEVHETILENGLTVILIPMDSPGLVSYHSVVRTGSRDEWEPGKSGFAHFFEHMMFRGTEKYPGPIYDSLITSIGADANAYTTNDRTVYHLNFASEDLEKVIELESDRFQNLKYSLQDFQTEAGAVYGEYRKSITSPWSVGFEKMYDMAFDKHTYKHTTIGFERDIIEMPNQYDYSISFFKRYYRPDNIVVLIVGDIEPNHTLKLIEQYYGNWEAGYVPPQITPEPEQKGERREYVKFDGKTLPIIMIAFKGDAFDVSNKNVLASYLLEELAFGSTSDIYKQLVLNEQKVQFISAGFNFTRDPGLLSIYSMIKNPSDINYVENEVYNVLEKFKNELVDEEKLENLKKRTKYQFLMRLDNPKSVASSLPMFLTYVPTVEIVDELFNNIMKLTPEDIKEAANHYFQKDKRNVITVEGVK